MSAIPGRVAAGGSSTDRRLGSMYDKPLADHNVTPSRNLGFGCKSELVRARVS